MSDAEFLHGVDFVDKAQASSALMLDNQGVIGLIGTAPEADVDRFPLDEPVLIAGSDIEAAFLGDEGTLPEAVSGIFKQCYAQIVVVRVAGENEAGVLNAVIGGYRVAANSYAGVHVFKDAKAKLGVVPKVLIAPGFSKMKTVADELVTVADVLTATVVLDGPNTTDEAAQAYVKEFVGKENVYVVDPQAKVASLDGVKVVEMSPFVAGVMAGQSYAESPSNVVLRGVVGTARGVDFRHGDANCRANLLNKNFVATVIREDGFRLWGNYSAAGTFLSSYRIKDHMKEGIRKITFPHVDRSLTEAKVDYILKLVNNFLDGMVREDGALRYGEARAPKERNSAEMRRQGRLVVCVAYEDVTPMQRVSFEMEFVAQD